MAFELAPEQDIRDGVRQVATEQIDRALARFSSKSKGGNAVHETRKSLKRLRALVHLIKAAIPKSDFKQRQAKLKQIANSLSGVRDIQAMLETMAKLEAWDERAGRGRVVSAIRDHLEAKRDAAEKALKSSGTVKIRKQLKEVRKDFDEIVFEQNDFKYLASTIEEDYRLARRSFRRAYKLNEDEAFHDWRKYVQRHWRQLLLVAPSWPKALRPNILLARDLSEVLGEDHDLYVLLQYIQSEETNFGSRRDVKAYLSLCQDRQRHLRLIAHDMGSRLLAEKPSSLATRLNAYWKTAPQFDKPELVEEEAETSNVISLKRKNAASKN